MGATYIIFLYFDFPLYIFCDFGFFLLNEFWSYEKEKRSIFNTPQLGKNFDIKAYGGCVVLLTLIMSIYGLII